MEIEQRESGLIVPKEKPAAPTVPKRYYGPLEIRDESRRELVKQSLMGLWNAIGLSNPPGGISLPGESAAAYEARKMAYFNIGKMLLGEKYCPVGMIKC